MSKAVVIGIVLFVVLILGAILFSITGYVAHGVRQHEVALKIYKSRVTELVSPGQYTALGLWHDIVDIDIAGKEAIAKDPEVLTSDQQRIGLKVSATVRRPGMELSTDEYRTLWSKYKTIYTSDEAMIGSYDEVGNVVRNGVFQEMALQSMKVCVGDRTFSEAAVGESRDDLRKCIEENLSSLLGNYGLYVENTVVPEIIISQQVQAALDQITDAKFAADLAKKNELKAVADANRELAIKQGEIRVAQGELQEQHKQEAITAEFKEQAVQAQLAVIEAQLENQIRQAELQEDLANELLEVALIEARETVAEEQALAEMYDNNPDYITYLTELAWANALATADTVLLPAGVDPSTVFSPNGDITTVLPAGE